MQVIPKSATTYMTFDRRAGGGVACEGRRCKGEGGAVLSVSVSVCLCLCLSLSVLSCPVLSCPVMSVCCLSFAWHGALLICFVTFGFLFQRCPPRMEVHARITTTDPVYAFTQPQLVPVAGLLDRDI